MKSTILQNFYTGEEPPRDENLTQPCHMKQESFWLWLKDELEKKLAKDPEGAGYFDKYDEMVQDIIEIHREEAFLQGFRNGALLMAEVFSGAD